MTTPDEREFDRVMQQHHIESTEKAFARIQAIQPAHMVEKHRLRKFFGDTMSRLHQVLAHVYENVRLDIADEKLVLEWYSNEDSIWCLAVANDGMEEDDSRHIYDCGLDCQQSAERAMPRLIEAIAQRMEREAAAAPK